MTYKLLSKVENLKLAKIASFSTALNETLNSKLLMQKLENLISIKKELTKLDLTYKKEILKNLNKEIDLVEKTLLTLVSNRILNAFVKYNKKGGRINELPLNWLIYELSKLTTENERISWNYLITLIHFSYYKNTLAPTGIFKAIGKNDYQYIKEKLRSRRNTYLQFCKKNKVNPDFYWKSR